MYTLRFPFRLPPGREIGVEHVSKNVGGVELSLNKDGILYVLTAEGYSSEEDAKSFVVNIRSGLAWLLLKLDISTKVDQDDLRPEKIMYAEDAVDGASPAVYLTSKRMTVGTGNQPQRLLTTPSQMALDAMAEGLSFPKSSVFVEDDPKLALALDLYGSYFTEHSANARFLTLIMALEALANDVCRHSFVLDFINRWRTEVTERIKELDPNSDGAKSLQALTGDRFFRGNESIQRQIQNLVILTLKDVPSANATQQAKTAKKLYKIRSKLLHNGTVKVKKRGSSSQRTPEQTLNCAISEAKCLVHLILITRFKKAMGEM